MAVAGATARVTVVVPTVGRPMVAACVASLLACSPRAERIIVADQSGGKAGEILAEHLGHGVEIVPCDGAGTARCTNAGLRAAADGHVFVTHDDCRVAENWIGEGLHLIRAYPDAVITGRVFPDGDAELVPSTVTGDEPRDFTGTWAMSVLYPSNMIVPRNEFLNFGGFDERRTLIHAEDNDFCYRWIRSGHPLRYEPGLVVWHREWRTPQELDRLYRAYNRCQGALYAKHLAHRDWRMLRYLGSQWIAAGRNQAKELLSRQPPGTNDLKGSFTALPRGFVEGWLEDRRLRRRVSPR